MGGENVCPGSLSPFSKVMDQKVEAVDPSLVFMHRLQ